MKKLFSILVCVMIATMVSFAQDIIVTNSSLTSENSASILLLSGHVLTGEIVEMNSKYVVFSDNGVNKTVPASQIQSVTLANGQVRTYGGTSSVEQTESQLTITNSEKEQSKNGRIYRDNGHYLHNETYISGKEVERILQKKTTRPTCIG